MGILKKDRAFVRLLRELGIFQLWLNNRISYLKDIGCGPENLKRNIFLCVEESKQFRRIIDDSFSWAHTDCEQLWVDLYDLYETSKTPLQILIDSKNSNLLEIVKYKIQNYLKDY